MRRSVLAVGAVAWPSGLQGFAPEVPGLSTELPEPGQRNVPFRRLSMPVSIPIDPCYHYECSEGRVRLTYFLPAAVLQGLVRRRRISPRVLEDFPDGVDLDCTEPDFADFQREYGFRPPHDPDSLQHAFFAILSSTRGWRGHRGVGLLQAEELEEVVPEVERIARESGAPEDEELLPEGAAAGDPRRRGRRRAAREARRNRALVGFQVSGVDPARGIGEQAFRPVRMERGRSAHEVFSLLQLGEGGGAE